MTEGLKAGRRNEGAATQPTTPGATQVNEGVAGKAIRKNMKTKDRQRGSG
jgi:hypothetical protein